MIWLCANAMTLGTLVMAIAAVAALIYAHLQIAEGRKAEHLANANELWRETLRLAFDNPKLSDPTLGLAKFDYDNRTIDGSVELFQKYELYVDTERRDLGRGADQGVAGLGAHPAPAAPRLSPVAAFLQFRLSRAVQRRVPQLRRGRAQRARAADADRPECLAHRRAE